MTSPGFIEFFILEAGDYVESAKTFQGAINQGLGEKELAGAHKHLAFIHCAASREKLCRDEFRKALAIDPGLELTPAEAGHPIWGPIFASLKGSPAPFKLALQQYDERFAQKGDRRLGFQVLLHTAGAAPLDLGKLPQTPLSAYLAIGPQSSADAYSLAEGQIKWC